MGPLRNKAISLIEDEEGTQVEGDREESQPKEFSSRSCFFTWLSNKDSMHYQGKGY